MPIREITASGSIFALDHETFGANQTETAQVGGTAIANTDGRGAELLRLQMGVGGEVRVELELNVSADEQSIAFVDGVARLFEGDDEATQDLEQEKEIRIQVLPGQPRDVEINLFNQGFGGGDRAKINLNLTNSAANIAATSGAGSAIVSALPKQDNWRWCHKCTGLWFAGGDSSGSCTAGGTHESHGSGNYALVHDTSYPEGQLQWRWCAKCMGLWFSGNLTSGRCPTGGGHSQQDSGNYVLTGDPTSNGQRQWRWCAKCQGLHFVGNGGGRCPAGGPHSSDGSGDYALSVR